MQRTQSITALGVVLFSFIATQACSGQADPQQTGPMGQVGQPTTGVDLSPLTIAPLESDPGSADVIWRYLDPQSGEVKSATRLDEIPEQARRQVVVFDPRRDAPPGHDFVADVSKGLPATAHPVANFAFPTRAAMAPVERAPTQAKSAANSGPREVIMFSTQGCGYCNKARKFLTAKKIPFTELDVEEDPGAPARLQALGQKAGLGARDLQGVPILFIDGRPLIGWDERQAARLLGLSG